MSAGTTAESLRDRLIRHEALRLKAYRDTVGKLTIGVGRNLDDRGIRNSEAMFMLDNDIAEAQDSCKKAWPWFSVIPYPVQDVLVEMVFQMGIAGVMQFTGTLDAIKTGDYPKAARNMRGSLWHQQTPGRCEELAGIVERAGSYILVPGGGGRTL